MAGSIAPAAAGASTPVPDFSFSQERIGANARLHSGLTFDQVLACLWRRKFLFLFVFGLIFTGSATFILRIPRVYTSEAMLIVDPRQSQITGMPSVQEKPVSMLAALLVRSEVQILGSEQLARHAFESLDQESKDEFAKPKKSNIEWLTSVLPGTASPTEKNRMAMGSEEYQKHFAAGNDLKSFIISTSFTASTPELAQRLLSHHLQIYLEEQRASKQAIIAKAEAWFASELRELETTLRGLEARQQAFRQSNELLSEGGVTRAGRQLVAITADLSAAQTELSKQEARLRKLRGSETDSSISQGADTALQSSEVLLRLRDQEASASQRVAELRQRFGSNSQELKAAQASLAEVRTRISEEIGRRAEAAENDVVIARANVKQLEDSLHKLEGQMGEVREAELADKQLQREIDTDRALYLELLSRSKHVASQKETQEPDVQIVSAPSLAMKPTSPRTFILLLIAGTAAGFAAGAIALIRHNYSSNGITGLADIESECGLAGLAIIPRLRRAERRLSADLNSRTHLAASLETLQNSIFYRLQETRSIVVASSVAGEGKTLTSALLARTLVASGFRVLLVDADLRHRELSKLLGLSGRPGLTDQLRAGGGLSDSLMVAHPLGFAALPAGTHANDLAFLLRQEKISIFLQSAKNKFDVVVFDTPPIAIVDDALPFAALADATILVARDGKTTSQLLYQAARRLRLAHANIVGATLNDADPKRHRVYSSYYPAFPG